MTIYTSSWFTFKGPGRIGISRGNPRGVAAGYRLYKPLAPTWDIIKNSANKAEYEPRYYGEVLDHLDPHQVLADLRRLAGDATPVLMCYERPPFTDENFCHRHMAGDWLAKHTGVDVKEWSGCKESNLELPLDATA